MSNKRRLKSLTCTECGTIFERFRRQKFCSKRCATMFANRARGKGVELTCGVCGAQFHRALSWKNAKYCSRVCWRKRPTKHTRTVVCQQCAREFDRVGHGPKAKYCSMACRAEAMRKGGYVSQQGYRVISANSRQLLEHRAVMEGILGRSLLPTETVHHKNGDRLDNRPENLELWDTSQPPGQHVPDKIAWCIQFLARHRALIPEVS